MKIITPRQAEVTVRRQNGNIETIIHPSIQVMNDSLLAKMNEAMAKAGRGKVISYRNIDAVIEREESDYMTRCERCGKKIDTRNAYGQKEWTRIGANKVKVMTYYCDSCHQLLATIGAGEKTEMSNRAANVPSYEPETK